MKKTISYLPLFLLLFVFGSVFSQQGGTSCADAITLYLDTDCDNSAQIPGPGSQYNGNYNCPDDLCGNFALGAGNGVDDACSAGNKTGQCANWFRVQATTTTITVDPQGAPYAGSPSGANNSKDYAIYSGSCGSLSLAGTAPCADALAGNGSHDFTGLTVGEWYYIQISCVPGNSASVVRPCFTSTVAYVNPNNNCASPLVVTDGVEYLWNTANATDGPGAEAGNVCGGSTENNIWARWCAPAGWPAGQTAYIHIYNQTCNSTLGLQFSVYLGNEVCGAFTGDGNPPTITANMVCANPGVTTDYFYTWPANPGVCYMIQVDGYAGTACTFNLQINDSPTTFPVSLAGFWGRMEKAYNQIRWSSATEVGFDRYELQAQRLTSSLNVNNKDWVSPEEDWTPIAEFEGAGQRSDYEFKDTDLSPVKIYRLKMIDLDGTFNFSNIIEVNRTGQDEAFIPKVYPVPTTGKFLTVEAEEGSTITIFDQKGTAVITSATTVGKIDVSKLSPGIYFYSVTKLGTKPHSGKLMKVN